MPNAIAPTDAQINIAKSNKFAITTAFGMNTPATATCALKCVPPPDVILPGNPAIV